MFMIRLSSEKKQMDEESFDKIWKVMSMERYDIIREASSRRW